MKRIGLLADTHGYLDPAIFKHFESCDEIWHAGDWGSVEVATALSESKILRGVSGNIDGQEIRNILPEISRWTTEGVRVLMVHIGGYPPKYNPAIKKELKADPPDLFICGHSHILRIMYDKNIKCLYMNPGAAGRQGWHKVRTLIRFTIDGREISHCEVIELGSRG